MILFEAYRYVSGQFYYINGKDSREEGVWRQTSDEFVPFLNWGANQPNSGNTENCLVVLSVGMHDIGCLAQSPAICQLHCQ